MMTFKTVDGEWDDFDPILPKQEANRPGVPILTYDASHDPLELFTLFFPRSMVKSIVANTNSYSKVHLVAGGRKWKRLTINEFYVWLGISVYMGICRQPST